MLEAKRDYVPAAGKDWLLPLYDLLLRLIGAERVKRELVEQAVIEPNQVVLDTGCGTGSLAVLIKGLHPEAEVVGLDPDPKALVRGRRKAEQVGLSVRFNRGFAQQLPYPDGSFDRVFSSFMFHHLDLDAKQQMLKDSLRVLKPGGTLHLLDFVPSAERADGFFARLLHSTDDLQDNAAGRIPSLMQDAGFRDLQEVGHRNKIFGRVAFFRAAKPH